MRNFKSWLRLNERVLNFKYPETSVGITAPVFFKKFFVDWFFIKLIALVLLFIALDPFGHPENLAAFVGIFVVVLLGAMALEAIPILAANFRQRRSKK